MNKTIFDNMNDGFAYHEIICDENGKAIDYVFLEVNTAFERITGLRGKEIIGKSAKEIYPDLEDTWIENYGQVALSGEKYHFVNYSASNDKYFDVDAYSPEYKKFAVFFRDITEFKKYEFLLRKYKILFDNATDIILFIKMDGSIVEANEAASKNYGYSIDELLKMKIFDLRTDDSKMSEQMSLADNDRISFEAEHKIKDGKIISVEINSMGVEINNERILISIIRNISEKKKYLEKIEKLAYMDMLTGIPNRKYFIDKLDRFIKEADSNTKFAVVFLDIDKFKDVNDIYGHSIGDKLLIKTSERINKCIQNSGTLARLGGDEFVILVDEFVNYNDMNKLFKCIINSINRPYEIDDLLINSTVSVGISLFPKDGITREELMKKADIAMYKVKSQNRNGFAFY